MNALRLRTSPVAVGSIPGRTLAALLFVVGCMARTPLDLPGEESPTPGEGADTGGHTGDVGAGASSGGGNAASTAGQGGAGSPGGILATGGSPGMGGASGGIGSGTGAGGRSTSPLGGSRSGGSASAQAGRTTISSGGRTVTGGATLIGGGATAVKGGTSGGGTTATGRTTATGGNSGRDAGVGKDGATAPGTPTITDSGYVTVSAGTTVLAGFVSSSTGGSGSSIALTFDSTSFCASGTVGKNSTYNCWATAGFTVNQAQSGMSGSSSPLAFSGSTVTVSYVNYGGSSLEFQLYDGSDYWCSYLPASTIPTTKTIPFSSLNTKCWDNSGTAFVSGTPITAVDLVVPGSNTTPTPYNFCFLGLTVQ